LIVPMIGNHPARMFQQPGERDDRDALFRDCGPTSSRSSQVRQDRLAWRRGLLALIAVGQRSAAERLQASV